MAKDKNQYETFNAAMGTILKADPQAVKAAMEADKQARGRKRAGKSSKAPLSLPPGAPSRSLLLRPKPS